MLIVSRLKVVTRNSLRAIELENVKGDSEPTHERIGSKAETGNQLLRLRRANGSRGKIKNKQVDVKLSAFCFNFIENIKKL